MDDGASKDRVHVPPGETWWAEGVLSDADFLRKLAEGLAAVDPRAFRLQQIAARLALES